MANDIEQARRTSQSASQRALQLSSFEPTVSDIIKERALSAFAANQDLIRPLDIATSELVTAPKVAREQYQNIFNPFEREKLVSQYQAQQAIPVQALSSILGQRFGRIEDIIGAGTRAFQAQSQAATGTAQLARQNLEDLLAEQKTQQTLALQLAQLQQERVLKERELALKEREATGGGLTFSNKLALFNALKPGAIQENNSISAQSGLTAVNQIRDILKKDPRALGLAGYRVSRFLGGTNPQVLYAAIREAADVLTRLRTGAALNQQEIKIYEENLPLLGDTSKTIETKLDRLEKIYESVLARGQAPYKILFEGLSGIPAQQNQNRPSLDEIYGY